jgi:rhomboid family GlyGly-CTERM serine protease
MRTVAFILLLSLACAAFGAGERLQYERDGAPWRLATGNIAHWSWDQLLWDGTAFLLLGLVCAERWRSSFYAALIASALAIPAAVACYAPSVNTYRGLSGIDSALFALAACRIICEERGRTRALVAIVFALFIAKIVFEIATGSTLFVRNLAPGVAAIPIAHVVGAIVGIFCALVKRGASSQLARSDYSPSFSRSVRNASSSAATFSSSRATRTETGSIVCVAVETGSSAGSATAPPAVCAQRSSF